MYRLIKKIHIYTGLLNFSVLLVFGTAGLVATFEAERALDRIRPAPEFRSFQAPANASDKQVADAVFGYLRIPLTGPIPEWAIRRSGQGQLVLDFYSVNGRQRVTVLENENRLQIVNARVGMGRYLNNLHTLTPGGNPGDLRLRLWAYYIEFSIWSLIGMSLSGVYLWLASRPRLRWAQMSFAAGSTAFIALYLVTR